MSHSDNLRDRIPTVQGSIYAKLRDTVPGEGWQEGDRPGGETPVQTVDEAYPMIYFDRCYISGCTCGKPKHDRQTEDDVVDPKATDPKEKLSLSDWDRLNNEVTRLTQQVGDLTAQNNILGAGMSDLNERLGKLEGLTEAVTKLMDTLEVQLGSIRDLHDTVKTQTRMIDRLKLRVTDLEDRRPEKTASKDNTSKMILKRFLAVQRICEASIELDTHHAVAPSSDRQWLAQSVLNILKGNVDE